MNSDINTVDVECLFLHAEHVGRDARVVSLETRHKRLDNESRRRVAWPEVAAVLLRMRHHSSQDLIKEHLRQGGSWWGSWSNPCFLHLQPPRESIKPPGAGFWPQVVFAIKMHKICVFYLHSPLNGLHPYWKGMLVGGRQNCPKNQIRR